VRDPVYRAWSAQNQIRSPHPLHYLAGYAIVGLLAILGAVRAVRRRQWQLVLPLAWTALIPLLLYLPINVQRRLIIGTQVPLGLLAACGLVCCIALPFGRSPLVRRLSRHPRYSRQGMRRLLVASVILFTVLTNLLLIGGNCIAVVRRAPPIYHSATELAALDWLHTNTTPQDTVLSAYETGNYVPTRAGNRVVLGLGTQTVDAERKQAEVRRFFDAQEGDDWRRGLLARYGVAYVLVGPRERALGSYDPDRAPHLIKVYDEGEYAIYKVVSIDR
jgi:asparagine N-glycosylation enzyme membrane subunit Stt3